MGEATEQLMVGDGGKVAFANASRGIQIREQEKVGALSTSDANHAGPAIILF